MQDLILRILKALLSSLYLLFDGIPAAGIIRRWFGGGGNTAGGIPVVWLLMLAAVLGTAACIIFLWLVRRRPGGSSADLLEGVLEDGDAGRGGKVAYRERP